ncbi:MAG TPA: cytochrome P450 [Polyangiaceae bacterium]|nr:cytochrome P450 [Polyangiaceae bacterium]
MASYDLGGEAFFADPDPTFRAMRERDPVYWSPELEAWVLTRYEDVRRALRDGRLGAGTNSRVRAASPPRVEAKLRECFRFLSTWMIFRDPPAHARLRAAVGRAFAPGAVAGLAPFVRARVGEALSAALGRGRLDVVRDLAYPLTAATSARFVGVPPDLVPDLLRWSADVFLLFGAGAESEEVVEAAHRSLVACRARMREVLAARGPGPADDLMGRLAGAPGADGALGEDEIIGTCVMLMIGGHETTAHLIGNGLLALLRHGAERRKLAARPDLLDAAVEELIRYDGPSVSVVRRAREDVAFGGATVRAGQYVFAVLRSANRDPAAFADPDRLDVERSDNRHLGLGHGIHFCVGATLARLQAKAAIGELLGRLPGLALEEGARLRWLPSLATRGLESLPVTFRAARPSGGG